MSALDFKFELMNQPIYFITGIDTNIGKTYVTGFLAKKLKEYGKSVITQKLIQTGNKQYAEDILQHRKMMGIELTEDDLQKLTMPAVFPYPASPHLASRLVNREINLAYLTQCTQQLTQRYDVVLVEGAGGLYVPIIANNEQNIFILDYIQQQQYPVILVTSGRLGSINHTILSLNALKQANISVFAVVYNQIDDHQDNIICQDTQQFLQKYLNEYFPHCLWWLMPVQK